jgi:sugar lactone lactonase YvrE
MTGMRRSSAWIIPLALAGIAAQPEKLLPVECIPWPEETRCVEMFSAMAAGPDGRVYAGTCNAAKIGARLIAFDPGTRKQEILADMQAVCGEEGSRTLPQSKIHSQICFDSRGVAWFGTHSYDWIRLEQLRKSPDDYTGGHLVSYDTRTKQAADHGILVPHESIMSLALAEGVGKIYCILHPTARFVVYDLRTKKVTDKGDLLGYPSRAIVALKDGRGFTFTSKGEVVRYSPDTDRYEKLGVSIPLEGSNPKSSDGNNPFALAVSEDEKRIYGTGWSSGLLFEYRPDDGPEGRLRTLGPAFGDEVVPGGRRDLCIAMAAGRDGRIYYAGYNASRGRVACYDPAADRRVYLGRIAEGEKPIGLAGDHRGSFGAMCALPDGRLVAADFDQKQTWYNLFTPPPK